MRIYIIGNDGITLCREPPAAVSKGEIVVGSTEELHAAPLSGKRLLALWNALPGVEKRRKVGDRAAKMLGLHCGYSALQRDECREAPRARSSDPITTRRACVRHKSKSSLH